jgi:MarR family transcriptional regulator, negative regulator of the multidrug operon emrRAB
MTATSATGATAVTTLRHGANVLRALARNLDALAADETTAPLDHASARDAVTLLGWRGEITSDSLQEALDLSQPACVRVVDRLAAAGLVTRRRTPGDRRLRIALTDSGERAATRLVRDSGEGVRRALHEALPGIEDLAGFVAALDRVATVVFGDATDTIRFCRSCDVAACVRGPRGCPSDAACRANVAQER